MAKCYQFAKFAKVWPLQNLGLYGKRKGRLVMAIAARVLVLVKSMETTRSYSYYFVVVDDGFRL